MSRHSDMLPRHPIKTSCQDTQTPYQDTLSRHHIKTLLHLIKTPYQDTHELELAIILTALALYLHPVGVICCHVSCLTVFSRACRPFFWCVYDVFESLFPLPRASKEHGWCLRLGQFLLFARHEWCQKQNSHRPNNGEACWNRTSHVAFLNFCKCCSRCLAQVKSTYYFPQIWDSHCCLYVKNPIAL